jgi:hypothetical protein
VQSAASARTVSAAPAPSVTCIYTVSACCVVWANLQFMQVNRSTASCHAVYPACLKMFSGGPRGERGPLLSATRQAHESETPSLAGRCTARCCPAFIIRLCGIGMGTQTERSGNGRQGIVSCLCTHQISSHWAAANRIHNQQRPLPNGTWTAVGTAGSRGP